MTQLADCKDFEGEKRLLFRRKYLEGVLELVETYELAAAWEDAAPKIEAGNLNFLNSVLEGRRPCYVVLFDSAMALFPVIDIALDGAQIYGYIMDEEFQFLAIMASGCLFNGLACAVTALYYEKPCCIALLNVCTLGVAGHLMESAEATRRGIKSPCLMQYKLFEAVESAISWGLCGYSLIIAGYVDGFKPLSSLQVAIKWASICTSLVCIPKVAFDTSCKEIAKSRDLMARVAGTHAIPALACFHFFDLTAMLVLFPMQVAIRPYGIFVYMFIGSALIFLFGRAHHVPFQKAFTQTPVLMVMVSVNKDPTLAAWSHVAGELRIIKLLAAWLIVAEQSRKHEELREQLCLGGNLLLLILAAVSFIGLIIAKWYLDRLSLFRASVTGYVPLLSEDRGQALS